MLLDSTVALHLAPQLSSLMPQAYSQPVNPLCPSLDGLGLPQVPHSSLDAILFQCCQNIILLLFGRFALPMPLDVGGGGYPYRPFFTYPYGKPRP